MLPLMLVAAPAPTARYIDLESYQVMVMRTTPRGDLT